MNAKKLYQIQCMILTMNWMTVPFSVLWWAVTVIKLLKTLYGQTQTNTRDKGKMSWVVLGLKVLQNKWKKLWIFFESFCSRELIKLLKRPIDKPSSFYWGINYQAAQLLGPRNLWLRGKFMFYWAPLCLWAYLPRSYFHKKGNFYTRIWRHYNSRDRNYL